MRCSVTRLAVAFVLLMAGVGCSAAPWKGFPPAADPAPAWPAPPEAACVAYVTAIRDHTDLFAEAGFWHSAAGWLTGGPDSHLVKPFALALHPRGGLLVTDPGRRTVHFYDWSRRRYVELGSSRPGGLSSPVGVAALDDGRILVSDSRLGSVESFEPNGRWLGSFVKSGVLKRPAGVAVNRRRREVYVVDVLGHAVAVFDLEGSLLRTIGGRGDKPQAFNFPTHVAIGPQDRLVVTDSLNFRVQILEPDGTFVRSIGVAGDAPGGFAKPKGVAVDPRGRIMVVEGLHDAVEFFDWDGRLLLSLGASGSGPGEFWLPAGLAFDDQEQLLFVADSYNSRVQVFRLIGAAAAP